MGNKCLRPAHEMIEDFQPLQTVKIGNHKELSVDWSDENSVHHRSAINSLHNYALGKMHLKEDSGSIGSTSSPHKNGLLGSYSLSRTSPSESQSRSRSISFAAELHQTFNFERQSISIECDRSGSEYAGTCNTHVGSDENACNCPAEIPYKTVKIIRGAVTCRSVLPQFPCSEKDGAETACALCIE